MPAFNSGKDRGSLQVKANVRKLASPIDSVPGKVSWDKGPLTHGALQMNPVAGVCKFSIFPGRYCPVVPSVIRNMEPTYNEY